MKLGTIALSYYPNAFDKTYRYLKVDTPVVRFDLVLFYYPFK
jgi:hypothetical protein